LTPPGKVANFTFNSVDCTVTEGQICRQRWQATLQLTEDTCTLNGDYRMDWTVACGAGLSGSTCALTAADLPSNVQFSLTSENFCAEVGVEVSLTGTMTSFEDAALVTPKTAFIVGRVGYFLVKINSELNGVGDYNDATATVKFGAANLKLVTVTVRQVGTTTVNRIWEKGVRAAPDSLNTVCTEIPKTVATVAFSFNFSLDLAKTLAQNSKLSFTVGAEVQVTYKQSKKRGLLQDLPADEKQAYNVDADVQGAETISSGTGTATTTSTGGSGSGTGSNGFVVVVSLALLLLSLMM